MIWPRLPGSGRSSSSARHSSMPSCRCCRSSEPASRVSESRPVWKRWTRRSGGKGGLFSVHWVRAGEPIGHTLYAFRDALGRLLYADRTGTVVKSLQELERFYTGIGGAKVYGTAALVEGAHILMAEGLAVLAMEVRAQLAVDPETAAQTLEVKKKVQANLPQPPAARYHVVQRGDWLSKLAQRYYGDIYKWPIIHEANRKIIGANPDVIKPGQELLIPDLPKVTAKRR
jgi:LysM repeat protein